MQNIDFLCRRSETAGWPTTEQNASGPNVRFGSKADIPQCPSNVRFTPESGHRNSAAAGPFFILDRPHE